MELPIEMLYMVVVLTFGSAIIGVWKQIPFLMFIGGALLTFIFLLTDSITAMGDTQTCTTAVATTTCTFQPYPLDTWVKIIFMLFGSMIMIGGALIWQELKK